MGTNVAAQTKTDTNLYVPVVTLSTEELLEQLKSSFKRTINCNKYQKKSIK